MTTPLDSDPDPWMRLCDAVSASGRSPADLCSRIDSGELRSRDEADGLWVHVEDLLSIWRADLAAGRAA